MAYIGKKKLLKQSKILYLQEFIGNNRCVVFFDASGSNFKPTKSFFIPKSVLRCLIVSSVSGVLLNNIQDGRLFVYTHRDAFYHKEIKFPLLQFLDGLPCINILESLSLPGFLQTVTGIVGLVDYAIHDFLLLFNIIDNLNNKILK